MNVQARELPILLDDGVAGKAGVRFSTGKVNKGVVDPQCIVVHRFLDTDGWWCELLRYNSQLAPALLQGGGGI
jgi:hypothetical protein